MGGSVGGGTPRASEQPVGKEVAKIGAIAESPTTMNIE
jgi:hypothetical protein